MFTWGMKPLLLETNLRKEGTQRTQNTKNPSGKGRRFNQNARNSTENVHFTFTSKAKSKNASPAQIPRVPEFSTSPPPPWSTQHSHNDFQPLRPTGTHLETPPCTVALGAQENTSSWHTSRPTTLLSDAEDGQEGGLCQGVSLGKQHT